MQPRQAVSGRFLLLPLLFLWTAPFSAPALYAEAFVAPRQAPIYEEKQK
jgi:hypothetical protein